MKIIGIFSALMHRFKPLVKRGKKVKIICSGNTAIRNQPKNLGNGDKALFAHEFSKNINAATIETAQNVDILNDTIFNKNKLNFYTKYTHVNGQSKREKLKNLILLFGPSDVVSKGVWIIDNWSLNYFHWFTDVMTRLIAAETFIDTHAVLLPEEYRNITYINQSLEILNFKTLFFSSSRTMHVKQLLLPSHTAPTGNYNKELINKVRNKFIPNNNPSSNKRIYISRQNALQRKITNESEVISILESYGFEIHLFEQYDFYKQVNLMQQTTHLVGLHGAGLTNMLFMPQNGKVLELRKIKDAHNNCYFSLASDLGHEYYYSLNEGDSKSTHGANITVDLKKLKRTIEEMI